MKVTGLITEYNPFHNGHLYHLEQSRKETGADYCVSLMSGSYVQRGAPAVYDKYVRTLMALQAGADLVIEMPSVFSTASAREFASYGIALFTLLGADSVCFGSEWGRMDALLRVAGHLEPETEEYTARLKEGLKQGLTFPESRSRALSPVLNAEEADILKSPNNILAVEYCLAARRFKSALSLHTIKRQGAGYHDTAARGCLGSATAIRQALAASEGNAPARQVLAASEGNVPARQVLAASEGPIAPARQTSVTGDGLFAVESLVPPFVYDRIRKEIPLFADDFSSLLNYRILTEEKPETIADMTPELAARIRRSKLPPDTFENRIQTLKSRQFTYTRVSRALLHLVLDIRQSEMDKYRDRGYAPYARILGFKRSAAPLLTHLKQVSSIPLITKPADAKGRLDQPALAMMEQEILHSRLYSCLKWEKGGVFRDEYTQPLIIL